MSGWAGGAAMKRRRDNVQHIVGVADMKVVKDPEDVLITYSLGSCLGVSVYDPECRVGGLVHTMLPLSRDDRKKAKENPYMYTDTGVSALLKEVYRLGGRRKNLVLKVAGGASMFNDNGRFRIGERNFTVLRKILWKNEIIIKNKEVGGTIPRTMVLYLDSGKTCIKSQGEEREL